jgi:hypothetical protein
MGLASEAIRQIAEANPRGYILTDPEDRKEFVAALRRFAPKADFEV